MRTLRPHAPALLAAVVVALVSWPVAGDMRPRLDLDGAWQIALRQAVHDGLDFGPDVLFTYGPLGFLRAPLLVYPGTARLAFAYGVLIHLALCWTLLWGLRRALGSLVAAALVAVLVAATIWQEPTLPIAFAAAVAITAGLVRGRSVIPVGVGLGTLAGIELLSKTSTGVALTGLALVAALAAPRRGTAVASIGAGLAGAVVVGWLGTGQPLAAVGDYVTGSAEIVSGYSEAMYFQAVDAGWELPAAFAIVVVGGAVAWRAGQGLERRARLGLLALWGVLAFTTLKAGFVRQDPVHVDIFFASALGALIAFGWMPHRTLSAVALGVALLTALLVSIGKGPADYIDPIGRAGRLIDQGRLLADPGATDAAIRSARAERARFERVDPGLLATARLGSVHVEPVDAGLPWAHGLRWRPLPVFQTYSAYTAELDARNAAMARDPRGPDRILREDGVYLDRGNPVRSPLIDAPAANREMLCHFRPGPPALPWLLLERASPRCGAARLLAAVPARLGTPAAVPPAPDTRSVVFVRIEGIAVSGLERVRTLLYRALPRAIEFDGGRAFRLLPGTAADGLVLRVPRAADFPAPFGLDQATNTLTVTRALDHGPVRLRFYAMTIR